MTEYGSAFYGSDEIEKLIAGAKAKHKLDGYHWIEPLVLRFNSPYTQYKLPIGHSFYNSDEFKRAKKPDDANPFADYSDDELQKGREA